MKIELKQSEYIIVHHKGSVSKVRVWVDKYDDLMVKKTITRCK